MPSSSRPMSSAGSPGPPTEADGSGAPGPSTEADGGADAALVGLHDALYDLAFGLADDPRQLRAQRDRVAKDLDGHRARLRDADAPLLVVLGGVTGAGKSTVVNTLAGERLVPTGVLRPTTRQPALLSAPADRGWFAGDRVLPGLSRVTGPDSDPAAGATLRLLESSALPEGIAIVDAPDVDSIGPGNRDLADVLLDAADVWLWFTTAGKYADEESMRYLRRARDRRTALAVALTQVRHGDTAEVVDDFWAKLAAEKLEAVELFVVKFQDVFDERLPEAAVADLRSWLWSLAPLEARRAHRMQTLEGALRALPQDVEPLIAAVERELRTARELSAAVGRAHDAARLQFDEALEQGLPLRQEVLARWNRFVGTGRFLQLAEEATGQARAWIRGIVSGAASAEERRLEREVRVEVADTVADVIVSLADLAAADATDAWARDPAGRRLVASHPELTSAADDLRVRAERMVEAWQQTVVELVETKGADRKIRARWLSTVINAAATGAIVIALAHTGGLTGAEAGIATAAGAANQTLLVKLLGAANLRWLIGRARSDLVERFGDLLATERQRLIAVLSAASPSEDQVNAVSDALSAATRAGR